MNRSVFAAVGVTLAATGFAAAAELPLRQVILSNSGLAQFTHGGPVAGNSTIELPVRLDQVDDILKSLTVFDRAGAVGTVSLPGKAPLPELFRDLPFGPEALNSSPDLLNALVGSEIEISGPVTAKGRVFRVVREQVALPNNGGTTARHRLTLMTPAGLTQAILEEVTELRFTDPQTRQQIERLLAGLTENRAKDRRICRSASSATARAMSRISYVVDAPVWKTAYRIVLPKDGGKDASKARLQGWAVVENLTGGDWKDIDLTLVSGNPVALRQPLYTALFANRPEVPVSTNTRIVPRRDDVQEKAAPAPPGRHAQRTGRPAIRGAAIDPTDCGHAGQRRSIGAHHVGAARTRRQRSSGRRGGDPTHVPLPGQALACDRPHHDGAIHRPRDSGDARVAVSARRLARAAARGGAAEK